MKYTLKLDEVGLSDIGLVGGKNASLGEMLRNLSSLGIKIPEGFALTVDAYFDFLDHNDLRVKIREIVESIDYDNIESLRRSGNQVRQLIRDGHFPKEMMDEILQSYKELSEIYLQQFTDVAVRSSATAEDLPDASFAGQQETYLNVRGGNGVLESVRNCFASLFTDRAISYRQGFGYDHFSVGLSVCIQKMVRSDLGISGVAFSLDTETGFKESIIINASYGLGELIVQGAIQPDEYVVFKPALRLGYESIIEKKLGVKDKMMIYGDSPEQRIRIIPTEKSFVNEFCLDDSLVIELSNWMLLIEEYYSKIKGKWTPMDVEWAVDGITNQLFVLQARPETIHSRKKEGQITQYNIHHADTPNKVLTKGIAVGDKIGCGKTTILYSLDKRVSDGHEFEEGSILVTDITDPDWEPIMKKASAIITNRGGRTCHSAIVARELGIPAIVGCGNATEIIQEGQEVTASCCEGEVGFVYEGYVDFSQTEFDLNSLPKTKTKIMLNVASPDLSFGFSHLPNSGVGLAREEFIINNYIQVHPLALLKHKSLGDKELSDKIESLISGYKDERDFFVKKLAYGISKIAAAFYPNDVIVRFSDFKSNEYFNLLGGKYFEPQEENPMIGWRGASRYYSDKYREAFGMECEAISYAREVLGLANIIVMIPFCRTVEELMKVYAVMKDNGLVRGKNKLRVYLMAEVPSNIILANEFSKFVDGFSIGSNDLTQLTLGLDRDSNLVAHIYDERNEAVKLMISKLIRVAKKTGVKVGICGQGPSDFPDFAEFLVEEGIDSISVTPDSIIKTINAINKVEVQG
jgi:pyruvate,water dikinase